MESVRTDLITILNRVAATNEFPIQFGKDTTLRELRLLAELIDRDYLSGNHYEDSKGVTIGALIFGITIPGRQYVEQLEFDTFRQSPKGKLATLLKYIGAIAIGIIGTLLTQWLAKHFGIQ